MKNKKLVSILTVIIIVASCACLLTGCKKVETDFAFGIGSHWYDVYRDVEGENPWAQAMFTSIIHTVRGGEDPIAISKYEKHTVNLKSDTDGWYVLDISTTGSNIDATIEKKGSDGWAHYSDITITSTPTSYDLRIVMTAGKYSQKLDRPTHYRILFTAPDDANVNVTFRKGFTTSNWDTNKGILAWTSNETTLLSPTHVFVTKQITYVPANKIKWLYDKLNSTYYYDNMSMLASNVDFDTLQALLSNSKNAILAGLAELKTYIGGNYHVAIAFGINSQTGNCNVAVYALANKNVTSMTVYGEIGHQHGAFKYQA